MRRDDHMRSVRVGKMIKLVRRASSGEQRIIRCMRKRPLRVLNWLEAWFMMSSDEEYMLKDIKRYDAKKG